MCNAVRTIPLFSNLGLVSGTERLRIALVIAWVVVIVALVVMAGISLASPPFGRDSSAFAYVGKGILLGEIPYLDRWDHKGPVTYLIYALGLLVPGWWGMWLINMVFLLGSACLAFRIVQREFGVTGALFAAAIFLIYDMSLGGGHTEQHALLFQFLALFLFLSAERKGAPDAWSCIAVGILGALSFLLRANLIGVWLAIGIYWTIRWRDSRSRIVWSTVGGLSVLAAVSFVFAYLGAWVEFWDATIWYNTVYLGASLADRIRGAMLLVWYLSPVAPLLGIGWCAGVWYQLTGRARGERFERIWPFVLILGPVEVVLSMMSGYGYGHYYLSLLPVGTLYLGFLVWMVTKKQLAAPAFLAFTLLFATLNYHMDIYNKAADVVRMMGSTDQERPPTRSERDLLVTDVVKQHSNTGDTILVWGAETQIHLLTERDSPTRFFYQYPLIRSDYTRESDLEEFISDVTDGRPAVIIDTMNSRLAPLDTEVRREWRPQKRYLHDPAKFQRLFDLVEAEYELVAEIEGHKVYTRSKSDSDGG